MNRLLGCFRKCRCSIVQRAAWFFLFFFSEGMILLQALTLATTAFILILGLLSTGCGNKLTAWKCELCRSAVTPNCSKMVTSLVQDSFNWTLRQGENRRCHFSWKIGTAFVGLRLCCWTARLGCDILSKHSSQLLAVFVSGAKVQQNPPFIALGHWNRIGKGLNTVRLVSIFVITTRPFIPNSLYRLCPRNGALLLCLLFCSLAANWQRLRARNKKKKGIKSSVVQSNAEEARKLEGNVPLIYPWHRKFNTVQSSFPPCRSRAQPPPWCPAALLWTPGRVCLWAFTFVFCKTLLYNKHPHVSAGGNTFSCFPSTPRFYCGSLFFAALRGSRLISLRPPERGCRAADRKQLWKGHLCI